MEDGEDGGLLGRDTVIMIELSDGHGSPRKALTHTRTHIDRHTYRQAHRQTATHTGTQTHSHTHRHA